MIQKVYQRGKMVGIKDNTMLVSVGELLLGSIIEPKEGFDPQNVEVPLVTAAGGHLQGKLFLSVQYNPVKKREETGIRHVTTTVIVPTKPSS